MDEYKLKDPAKPSGPITVRNLTAVVDRDLCIGAATCVAVAPLTYLLDSEAKAVFLDTVDTDTDDNIIDGAKSCPVAAIIITDEKGNKIFPK